MPRNVTLRSAIKPGPSIFPKQPLLGDWLDSVPLAPHRHGELQPLERPQACAKGLLRASVLSKTHEHPGHRNGSFWHEPACRALLGRDESEHLQEDKDGGALRCTLSMPREQRAGGAADAEAPARRQALESLSADVPAAAPPPATEPPPSLLPVLAQAPALLRTPSPSVLVYWVSVSRR